jgi:uncharacterized protein YjdB
MVRALRVFMALTAFLLASCSENTGPNLNDVPGYSISKVIVDPPSATILIPDTVTAANEISFSAVALGKGGGSLSGIRFAWSTSDPSIAVVDSLGVVTPIRPGTVEVIASAHKTGKALLEILPATQTVTVSPTRDTIFVDEPIVSARDTVRLAAKAYDPFGVQLTGVAFTWQSSAASVASVEPNGTVHATGLGVATVTTTASGRTASTQIHVLPLVASVNVSTPATQVLALDTLQLAAAALGYNGAPMSRTFSWVSSNPSVATVDGGGRVVFLSAGQVTFSARTAHRTSTATVTAVERRLLVMDAGDEFTCGIANLGRGYCWGLSTDGRTAASPDSSCFDVGFGLDPCILPPKRMNRPELDYTTVSAGKKFGCGITSASRLYCWGNDEFGQVGNGSDGAGETPSLAVTVKNERFSTVSAGAEHACALNLSGRAFCWGNDSHGQLGDHHKINSTTPIPVNDSLLVFSTISAGGRHTCGLSISGTAYCWGDGSRGQLGNGFAGSSDVPVLVSTGLSFIAIATGDSHTCAIDAASSMHCWGADNLGQLGIGGPAAMQLTPVPVGGGGAFTAVAAGDFHTCGIAAGGQVRCWGQSQFGEVGDGNVLLHTVSTPITVAGIQAVAITAGASHTCAMSMIGEALCWGSNRWGALGNEFQAAGRATPQVVARPR